MNHGFIKVCAVTPKIKVADCEHNKAEIISLIEKCAENKVNLAVFPELCITGYTCADLFFHRPLVEGALTALIKIKKATAEKNMLTVVGVPLYIRGKLYNCAAVMYNDKILGIVPKTHLPNYNEFSEKRHFMAADEAVTEIEVDGQKIPFGKNILFACREIPEFILAAEICEDLWAPVPPSSSHAMSGATIVANCSASNELVGKSEYRRELITSQSGRLVCGYVYASAGDGESTTDVVFSAHNLIAENGTILNESVWQENKLVISEIDVSSLAADRMKNTAYPSANTGNYCVCEFSMPVSEAELTRKIIPLPFLGYNKESRDNICQKILKIQTMGLKKRIEHTNANSLVIGLSGGLDSTLALLVTVYAADLLKKDRKDIIAVTMPCFGTTARTKSNAEILAEKFGVTFKEVNITKAVKQHFEDIGQDENNPDVTFENSQARERTQVLMDIANKTNGMVIGTGDLSELALGWATYNGDHMSMYSVNSSVPKTLVRCLVNYEADKSADNDIGKVLYDILDTPVSPELLPPKDGEISQKTEDVVGPYELHDFFLYNAVRKMFSPAKIFRLAVYAFGSEYDKKTILKWEKIFFRRFFNQQFKRSCVPDGPKVGSVSLSPRGDLKMPSDAVCTLWQKELDLITL